jgi:hypothetical protein
VVLIDIGISFEIQENSEILLLNATITWALTLELGNKVKSSYIELSLLKQWIFPISSLNICETGSLVFAHGMNISTNE